MKSFVHRLLWQNIYLPLFILKNGIDALFSAGHFGTILPPCRQVVLLRNPAPYGPRYLKRLLGWSPVKDNWKMRLQRLLSLLNIRLADMILTPTKAMREIVGAYSRIPLRKWRYAHYGYSPEPSNGDVQLPVKKKRGEKWVVYVTLWTPYKNFQTLIEAATIVRRRSPEVKFIFTVDFKQDSVDMKEQELIEKLGLNDTIIQVGRVSRRIALELLRQADVAVFASVLESFGHPMLEMASTGIPVVASDMPVNRELLGSRASYFNALDRHAFASIIETAVVYSKKHEGCSTDIALRFSWCDHVRAVLEMLDSEIRVG